MKTDIKRAPQSLPHCHHVRQLLIQTLKPTSSQANDSCTDHVHLFHKPSLGILHTDRQTNRHSVRHSCFIHATSYFTQEHKDAADAIKNTSPSSMTSLLTFLVANVGLMAKTWSSPSSCCQWAEFVLRERLRLWKELSALKVYRKRDVVSTTEVDAVPIHIVATHLTTFY